MFEIIFKQESPPAGNRKRRIARCITCPSISYPGGGGGPTLAGGGEKGVPTLTRERGYLPWLGGAGGTYLSQEGGGTYLGRGEGGTYLGQGERVSTLARGRGCLHWLGGRVTYLGQGKGVPTLARRVPTLARMG